MATYVVGDIHGAYKALVQVLEAVAFNKEKDKLITLGDICDGYPDVNECVELLLSIPNRVDIRGNHDQWGIDWMKTGMMDSVHHRQGGKHTAASYSDKTLKEKHLKEFFNKQVFYHVENEMAFIHAGCDPSYPLKKHSSVHLMWDRDMFRNALGHKGEDLYADPYRSIFIGHTTTLCWGKHTPMIASGVINMDTGCGHSGKLTIMNVETLEYKQSNFVQELYPGHMPRG